MRLLFLGAFFIQTTQQQKMSSYIYIKNFYLEEIQTIAQEYFNANYNEDSQLTAEILMKNSRTHFIQFNEDLAIEELLDWINTFHLNTPTNDRTTIIEGYLTMPSVEYKFYYIENDLYAITSNQQTYKIEELEELIPVEPHGIAFAKTNIPAKNMHSMGKVQFCVPKKKWWKLW